MQFGKYLEKSTCNHLLLKRKLVAVE